jgi:hypothetical protein
MICLNYNHNIKGVLKMKSLLNIRAFFSIILLSGLFVTQSFGAARHQEGVFFVKTLSGRTLTLSYGDLKRSDHPFESLHALYEQAARLDMPARAAVPVCMFILAGRKLTSDQQVRDFVNQESTVHAIERLEGPAAPAIPRPLFFVAHKDRMVPISLDQITATSTPLETLKRLAKAALDPSNEFESTKGFTTQNSVRLDTDATLLANLRPYTPITVEFLPHGHASYLKVAHNGGYGI